MRLPQSGNEARRVSGWSVGVLAGAALLSAPGAAEAQLMSAPTSIELHVRVVAAPVSLDQDLRSAVRSLGDREVALPGAASSTRRQTVDAPVSLNALATRSRAGGSVGIGDRSCSADVTSRRLPDGTMQHDFAQQTGEALVAVRVWVSADAPAAEQAAASDSASSSRPALASCARVAARS